MSINAAGSLGNGSGSRHRATHLTDFPVYGVTGIAGKVIRGRDVYIHGGSDSTLDRFGVRIGPAEIYRIAEQ